MVTTSPTQDKEHERGEPPDCGFLTVHDEDGLLVVRDEGQYKYLYLHPVKPATESLEIRLAALGFEIIKAATAVGVSMEQGTLQKVGG